MDRETSHSTENEIKFITNLGTYRPKEKRRETKEEFLEKRVDWGHIDKSECIRFAKKKLKEEFKEEMKK